MTITVKDFLSKAWSKNDGVAILNIDTGDKEPQYMAIMTARESWGDYLVDSFSIGNGIYGHDKVLHLWVYKEDN